MHAEKLLHNWLTDVMPAMHKRRLSALGSIISGALSCGRLTVTALGRSIKSAAKEKHNIKRADRLLSNQHLQAAGVEVYSRVAKQIIGTTSEPIILIDWSDVDARREYFLLRAAIVAKGRSLTLYEEVHDRSTKEKRATHSQFLEKLRDILPQDCKPVIVTDAGFRTPWFKKVEALGWDFVGRVRNREMVSIAENKAWIGAKSLYPKATSKPKHMKETLLTRSNPLSCSLVLYKSKPKGRVCLGKMGRKTRSRTSLVNSARAREPWLLATSLSVAVDKVVQIYSTRMQIEESFRDLKCPRYGLSLYFNGTYKLERLRILVLIGSLAAIFAWFLGKAAQLAKQDRYFQANTVRHHAVLSAVFIGIRMFRKKCTEISKANFNAARMQLPKISICQCII